MSMRGHPTNLLPLVPRPVLSISSHSSPCGPEPPTHDTQPVRPDPVPFPSPYPKTSGGADQSTSSFPARQPSTDTDLEVCQSTSPRTIRPPKAAAPARSALAVGSKPTILIANSTCVNSSK